MALSVAAMPPIIGKMAGDGPSRRIVEQLSAKLDQPFAQRIRVAHWPLEALAARHRRRRAL
jgi:hypothetical protein